MTRTVAATVASLVQSTGKYAKLAINSFLAHHSWQHTLAGACLFATLFILSNVFTLKTIITITVLLCLLLSKWIRFTLRRFLEADPLPPGPLTLPLLGSLVQIDDKEPQRTILKWKKEHGPIFTIALPVETVVICGYEELKKAASMTETSARPDSYLYTIFLHNKEEGNGMILSSGKTWTKSKNFANKHFNSIGVKSDAVVRRIEVHAANMVDIIEQTIEKEGEVINLHKAVTYTVASIIYELVLGRRYDISDERMWYLKDLLDGVLSNVQSVQMLIADNYPKLRQILPVDKEYRRIGFELQDFFRRELELNREMMQNADNNNDDDKEEDIDAQNLMSTYLNDTTQLKNGDMDLVLLTGDIWTGGMETTLTATRWAIIYFMQHPDVQEKLHDEIIERYPRKSNGEFSYSSRLELPYLCAVLDEILRLANVLPWNIPHRALKSFEINGHKIKEGVNLMFSYSSLHHDEENFPDPYTFNPERFLRRVPNETETVEWTRSGKDLKNFLVYEKNPRLNPFGMGMRKCPGEQLAMKEIFVFIISLVQRFRFVSDASNPPDMTRCRGMTSVPKEFVTRVDKREDWYGN